MREVGTEVLEGRTREKKGISGSTLKMIAIVTMFIDHVGAAFFARILIGYHYPEVTEGPAAAIQSFFGTYHNLYVFYFALRMIGRIAFPIYCFLLVQGFEHTRSRAKYALRLFLFCAVSEVPFDLAFNGAVLEFQYQNVFFTLFIGMLAMIGADWVGKKIKVGQKRLTAALAMLAVLAVFAVGAAAAQFLHTDYGARGIFCILALYLCRRNKKLQLLAGCLAFAWEYTAPLAFFPVAFYNGRRGWRMKYFFYLFYPVHLLLIYAVCAWFGMGGYGAV